MAEQLSFRLEPALPRPGDVAPMWPDAAPGRRSTPPTTCSSRPGAATGCSCSSARRSAGRGRRPDRGPDRPRSRAAGCPSSPGSRSGSPRGPRCSTASWWSSTRAAAPTTTALRRASTGSPGGPSRCSCSTCSTSTASGCSGLPLEKRRARPANASSGRATRSWSCPRSPARAGRSMPRSPPRGSPGCSPGGGRAPTCRASAASCGGRSWPARCPARTPWPTRGAGGRSRRRGAAPAPVLALFRRLPFDEEPRVGRLPADRANERPHRGRLPVQQHACPVDADREAGHERAPSRSAAPATARAPTAPRARPTSREIITNGLHSGTYDANRMNPAGAARQRQHRREVAHDRGDRQRQGDDLEVLGAAQQRARARVQRRVQREPEREVDEERDQQARRQAGQRRRGVGVLARAARCRSARTRTAPASAGTSTSATWVSPASPIPTILPSTSWRRGRGGDQQLHDPARLLGHDARGDPQPVEHERQEREHDEHDADDPAARVLRRVDRPRARARPRPPAATSGR